MKTVLVGIARMGSTRQPGKVLFPLEGRPVLGWIVEAARTSMLVHDVVIATTTDPRDDVIEGWCKDNQVQCFRGSENDILTRFYGAARYMKAGVAIRVTCDCPFIDPNVIDQVVALREATGAGYASNIDPPTWPDGLDCEAMTMETLRLAHKGASSAIDRECVTTWIQRNKHRIHCENLVCPLPDMQKERWVLDTANDFELCKKIAAGLPPLPIRGQWMLIKQFLEARPELRKINAHHPRNERFYAALADEPLPRRNYRVSGVVYNRAQAAIPLAAQTFSKSKVQYPSDSPLFVTHGDGGYCFDVDGNRYVDLVGGLLPNILGHRDPDVDWAIRRQLNNGIGFSLSTELETELAELLCKYIPCAEWARFGKNGSDVTTAAVRLARAYTGRDGVISAGYHGWHDWCVEKHELRGRGVPAWGTTYYIDHGDVGALEKCPNAAAVIVEPETDYAFLKACREFCDRTGALLIFDEVITGFRFGMAGAQGICEIKPDLACYAKAMANGMPISALVGKGRYYMMMEKIAFSGTYFGETLSIAAAIATIKKLAREDVPNKILARQRQLGAAICGTPGWGHVVRMLPGPMYLPRLEFRTPAIKTLFIQEMAQQGVLIIASHNLCYAHGEDEIRRVITAYKNVLPFVFKSAKAGTVEALINNRPIPSYANVRATGELTGISLSSNLR